MIVYIDNIILGLPASLSARPGLVARKCREACEYVGAVIKKGSEVFGTKVEWLRVELDAETKRFRLKQKFIEKLSLATENLQQDSREFVGSYRQWYGILSCVVYSIWTLEGSLWQLDRVIETMSCLALDLRAKDAHWDSPVAKSPDCVPNLLFLLARILKNESRSPPLDKRDTIHRAIGVSDASNCSLAWAIHCCNSMALSIVHEPAISHQQIFERELKAMTLGQTELLEQLPPRSAYTWWTDNLGALFVSRRELSCLWRVNDALKNLHLLRSHQEAYVDFRYIESKENPADLPSRTPKTLHCVGPSCQIHPAQFCQCFKKWIQDTCLSLVSQEQ